ncbi:MAG: LacI family transcriptional regulator [Phycisphaerae bacterium]|nr:LacI family transcriptional regulator [Phycisphaerae bacterium]
MNVTIVDIAKKAEVSISTVSRVLNNKPNVCPDRKQRILAAIDELDYKPNYWAQGIRKNVTGQKTGRIALLFVNLSERMRTLSFVMQYIQGIHQEIASAGKEFLFNIWHDEDETIPSMLFNRDVDGVIVKGQSHDPALQQWLGRCPAVHLNPLCHPSPYGDSIMVDYEAGTSEAVKYLASQGHRRIAYIAPQHHLYSQRKLSGFRRSVSALGLDVDENLIQIRGGVGKLDCGWAIDNLWSLSHPPTVIISDDKTCVSIYKALADRDIKIPQDVSVFGYDNDLARCESLMPMLSTMDLEACDIGRAAVRQILSRVENPQDSNRTLLVQGRIVERASVRKL